MTQKYETHLDYPFDDRIPKEIVLLRKKSPLFIENLFAQGVLTGLKKIEVLSPFEGVASAVFLAETSTCRRVLKFSTIDQTLNILAIKSWSANGVNTAKIDSHGIIKDDEIGSDVHFLVMDYSAPPGSQHKDGYPFLDDNHNQDLVQEFGRLAGVELKKINSLQLPSNSHFGGQEIPESLSFGDMISNICDQHIEIMVSNGIPKEQIQEFANYASNYPFIGRRNFAHNDFSPHNLIVSSVSPLELTVIDPLAIIALANWDFAAAKNRIQWIKEQYKLINNETFKFKLEREVWYFEGLSHEYTSDNKIDGRGLILQQIAQLILKLGVTGRNEKYFQNSRLNQIYNLKLNLLLKLLTDL